MSRNPLIAKVITLAVYPDIDCKGTPLDVAQFVSFNDAMDFVDLMLDQGCGVRNATPTGLGSFRGAGITTSDMAAA